MVNGIRSLARGTAALLAAVGAVGLGASAFGAGSGPIVVGHISGEINPITARYVDRVVGDGEENAAAAVIFIIDTPGGDIDSTYKITARFLAARVPIVTFVAPQGARAASAGTFITLAGNVAAMAPATNIGAAHPVDSNGNDIQGDLRTKIENDAVAHIVNIAKARGRNEQWAEDAVRKSVSARVDEAVALKVVDLEANDVPDLLAKIDGRTVKTPDGDVRLASKNAPVIEDGLNPIERLPLPSASGASPPLGAVGVAKTDGAARGIAHVAGEDWTVVSEGGTIATGGAVRVKRVDGVRLIVEPARDAEGRGAA